MQFWSDLLLTVAIDVDLAAQVPSGLQSGGERKTAVVVKKQRSAARCSAAAEATTEVKGETSGGRIAAAAAVGSAERTEQTSIIKVQTHSLLHSCQSAGEQEDARC